MLPCRLEVARPLDRDSRWAWRWRCCFGGDCACCRGRVVALTLWGCAAVCIGRGRGCLRGCSLLQDGLCAEGRKEASKERPVCRHGGAGGAGGCAVWEDCRQALAHPTALIAEDQLGLCCSTVETATLESTAQPALQAVMATGFPFRLGDAPDPQRGGGERFLVLRVLGDGLVMRM